jgi:hypothetical protein
LDTFLKAGAVWGNDGSDAKSGIFCHGGRKEQAKGPVAGDLLRDVVRMHDTRVFRGGVKAGSDIKER